MTGSCPECGSSVPDWRHFRGCTQDQKPRTCERCGDSVQYLSSDSLCDGCVAEEASEPPVEDASVKANHEIVVEIYDGIALSMKCIPCRARIPIRPERAAAGLVDLNELGRGHVEASEPFKPTYAAAGAAQIHHAQAGALFELAEQLRAAGHETAAEIAYREGAVYSTWALNPLGPVPDEPMPDEQRRSEIRRRRPGLVDVLQRRDMFLAFDGPLSQ